MIYRISLVLGLLFSVCAAFAQQQDSTDINTDVCIYTPEIMPEYPGGQKKMGIFIRDHLCCPVDEAGCKEGRVFVSFVVNTDGTLSTFTVVKGLGEPYDRCAVEVLQKMPNWIPGSQSGKLVRMLVPVVFHL